MSKTAWPTVKCLILHPDGRAERATFSNPDSLQKLVGGYFEVVPFGTDAAAYINEEGKMNGLPRNAVATKVWHQLLSPCEIWRMPGDFLVGPVIVVGLVNQDGRDTDIPGHVLTQISVLLGRKL